MFKVLRKNMKIIIWIIVLAFGVWGIGSFLVSKQKSTSYAGSVFGKTVSYRDFERTLKLVDFFLTAELRRKDGSLPDLPEEYIYQATWEELALQHEAKKRKIKVTDAEVRQAVHNILGAQGPVNERAYADWTKRTFHEQPRYFEEGVRKLMCTRKLLKSVADEVSVTPQEIKQAYFTENRELHLLDVLFSFDDARQTMPVSELINEEKKQEYISRNLQTYTRERAQAWVDKLTEKRISFNDAARADKFPVEDLGQIKGNEEFIKLAVDPNAVAAIKEFKIGSVSDAALSRDGYRVFYVKEVKEPTEEEFEKDKDEFTKKWIGLQKREALKTFLTNLLKQAKIESYIPVKE